MKKIVAMRRGYYLCVWRRSLIDALHPSRLRTVRQALVVAAALFTPVSMYAATPSPPVICDGRHASIMPGVGIGPVKIGEDIRSLLAVLQAYPLAFQGTDPDRGGWGDRDPNIVQAEPGVLIYHKRIVEIFLHAGGVSENGKCFTPAGIRLGSLKDVIRVAYGEPPSTRRAAIEEWVYNALGIAFDFDPAYSSAKHWPPSATTQIRVFAPGQFCSTLDLESQKDRVKISCAQYAPPP